MSRICICQKVLVFWWKDTEGYVYVKGYLAHQGFFAEVWVYTFTQSVFFKGIPSPITQPFPPTIDIPLYDSV